MSPIHIWSGVFQLWFLCCMARWVSLHASPLRVESPFLIALWFFWHQPCWSSKPDVLGLISSMQVPRAQVPDIGTACSSGRSLYLWDLIDCGLHPLEVGFLVGPCLCLFIHLTVDLVLYCRGAVWLVFRSFSYFHREYCLYVAVDLLCPWEENAGPFLGCYWTTSHPLLFFFLFFLFLFSFFFCIKNCIRDRPYGERERQFKYSMISGNNVRIKHYWK